MSKMTYQIRLGTKKDGPRMQALLPLLAEFELPSRRTPEDLWQGDEQMLLSWLAGNEPDFFSFVALIEDAIIGVAMVRLGDELLSQKQSAHLEVIVVDQKAQGSGVGKALLAQAETEAKKRGAQTMTLHVFANNHRARRLYEATGYEGELLRYIKELR